MYEHFICTYQRIILIHYDINYPNKLHCEKLIEEEILENLVTILYRKFL